MDTLVREPNDVEALVASGVCEETDMLVCGPASRVSSKRREDLVASGVRAISTKMNTIKSKSEYISLPWDLGRD